MGHEGVVTSEPWRAREDMHPVSPEDMHVHDPHAWFTVPQGRPVSPARIEAIPADEWSKFVFRDIRGRVYYERMSGPCKGCKTPTSVRWRNAGVAFADAPLADTFRVMPFWFDTCFVCAMQEWADAPLSASGMMTLRDALDAQNRAISGAAAEGHALGSPERWKRRQEIIEILDEYAKLNGGFPATGPMVSEWRVQRKLRASKMRASQRAARA